MSDVIRISLTDPDFTVDHFYTRETLDTMKVKPLSLVIGEDIDNMAARLCAERQKTVQQFNVPSTAPVSGPAPHGTMAGLAKPGARCTVLSTGEQYVNIGTTQSPEWRSASLMASGFKVPPTEQMTVKDCVSYNNTGITQFSYDIETFDAAKCASIEAKFASIDMSDAITKALITLAPLVPTAGQMLDQNERAVSRAIEALEAIGMPHSEARRIVTRRHAPADPEPTKIVALAAGPRALIIDDAE
jgi:hypothetical protein